MHYVKRNRTPESWKAIVMIGSVGMYSKFALSCQRHRPTDLVQRPGRASQGRRSTAPQSTVCWVSCVLWTPSPQRTISVLPPSTLGSQVRRFTNLCFAISIYQILKDTSILELSTRVFLAGLPMTPVPRIAGAVFRAATDPDVSTSGCPWVLPDDGPVIRVEKEALRAGVYELLNARIRRVKG
jgi:hypothetical protein